ncbi:hypothetical protein FKM82_000889 [Ascaphus truei]
MSPSCRYMDCNYVHSYTALKREVNQARTKFQVPLHIAVTDGKGLVDSRCSETLVQEELLTSAKHRGRVLVHIECIHSDIKG